MTMIEAISLSIIAFLLGILFESRRTPWKSYSEKWQKTSQEWKELYFRSEKDLMLLIAALEKAKQDYERQNDRISAG